MYYKLICILYALLCGQNVILVKSGCYKTCGLWTFRNLLLDLLLLRNEPTDVESYT
jgi:hypothetical protein